MKRRPTTFRFLLIVAVLDNWWQRVTRGDAAPRWVDEEQQLVDKLLPAATSTSVASKPGLDDRGRGPNDIWPPGRTLDPSAVEPQREKNPEPTVGLELQVEESGSRPVWVGT